MSGLSRTPGKRVRVNSPPRVRIPPSPPESQIPCALRPLLFPTHIPTPIGPEVKLLMSIFGKDDPKRQQVSNNIISGVAPGATGIKVRHTPTARGPDLIGNELSCIEGSGIDIGPHDTAALDRFVQDVAPHFHLMTPEQQAEFPRAIEALRQFPEGNRAGVASFLRGVAERAAGSGLAHVITSFLVR